MQNQPAKNAPLDMNKWREIIEDWNRSGETQKSYCERLGININTFSYARTKLLQNDKPNTQFVPLVIKNNIEERMSNSPVIILENMRGYKLHLPISLSLEQFAKLFKLSGWNDA